MGLGFVGLGPALKVQRRNPVRKCQVRMIEQNTLVAVGTMLCGVGGGIGLVAWTEGQGKRTEERVNVQTCVECKGVKTVVCNVCLGSGVDNLNPDKVCGYCDGEGRITCFNCNGTGIQPRFLDRLSPDDFMD